MPRVTRRRTLEAPVPEVWKLVSDPYALPRWWPRVSRVEDVDQRSAGRRSQWLASWPGRWAGGPT